MSERDVMEYDVLTVGAGPAGLAFALRLKQKNPALSVCVIEKASSVGAHALSGAVIETEALDDLVPGWRSSPPPICVPTCSAGLMRLRTELLNSLPEPTSPARPANESTTN